MSIWMAGRNFKRQGFQQNIYFTESLTLNISVIKTMKLQSPFGIS